MNFKQVFNILPKHVQERINSLKDMRERPDYHPEPSAFHHIQIVTNRCIMIGDKDLIMAGLLHDMHKADTMKINEKTGWPTSPGHDKWAQKSIEKDHELRKAITDFGADPDIVAGICGQHMRMHQIGMMKKSKQVAMINLPFFVKLAQFSFFDNMLIDDDDSMKMANIAITLAESSIAAQDLDPMLLGKHLIR